MQYAIKQLVRVLAITTIAPPAPPIEGGEGLSSASTNWYPRSDVIIAMAHAITLGGAGSTSAIRAQRGSRDRLKLEES